MAKKLVTYSNYSKIADKMLIRAYRSPVVTIFYWIVICSYSIMAALDILYFDPTMAVAPIFYVLGYSALLFSRIRGAILTILVPGAILWALHPVIILKIMGLTTLALTFVVILIKWPGNETTEWLGLHNESTPRSKSQPKSKPQNKSIENQINKTRSTQSSGSGISLYRASQAEDIVRAYGDSLGIKCEGIAKPVSLLKNSKEEIRQAYRDFIVYMHEHKKLTREYYNLLLTTYSNLDGFVEDEKARIISLVGKQIQARIPVDPANRQIYDDYMTTIISVNRMSELEKLVNWEK